ncbi:MAG: WecB/TagA/CpsF family glycosyltransferase [Polyangiaceae bacterium]
MRALVGDVPVDNVDLAGAVNRIDQLVSAREGGTVFTPNVDHVVLARQNERFRSAYGTTDLSLADGWPVVWAAGLLGTPLLERVAGSDLVEPVMRLAAQRGYRVYFLGGDPGVAEKARDKLLERMPELQIIGTNEARVQLGQVDQPLVEQIREQRPDIILVALGAPEQEIFCQLHRDLLKPAVLLGVGASLDFVAGTRVRAPQWIARNGLEWLFRFAQEPRRLAYRYFVRDPEFFLIVLNQLRKQRASKR